MFSTAAAPDLMNYNVLEKRAYSDNKTEIYKSFYPNSSELLLKFEEHPQRNPGQSVFTAGYTAVH